MTYTLTRGPTLRWRVTCPDKSTFHTSSLDEALAFIKNHIEAKTSVTQSPQETLENAIFGGKE